MAARVTFPACFLVAGGLVMARHSKLIPVRRFVRQPPNLLGLNRLSGGRRWRGYRRKESRMRLHEVARQRRQQAWEALLDGYGTG